ncbi:branched-chain amino acid transport system / permease component family protein, partial [Vibrio parahaemolyticus V-223/04]
SAVRSTGIT